MAVAVAEVKDWVVGDQGLSRSFSFETVEHAFAFVNRIKAIGDETEVFPKVEFDGTSVSITIKASNGQLTKSDFELADRIYNDMDRLIRFFRGNTLLAVKGQASLSQASDQELKDALRISSAWFVLCRNGSKCEFTEEDVVAMHVEAASEMIKRDMLLLLPAKSLQQELFVKTTQRLVDDRVIRLDETLHARFGKRHTKERLSKTHDVVAEELQKRDLQIAVNHALEKSTDHIDLIGWHMRVHSLGEQDPHPLINEHEETVRLMEAEGLWHDPVDLLDAVWLEKQRRTTTVQTLIFDKKTFKSREQAIRWARSHNFRSDKVDETENSFRLRQRDPSEFEENSFRTIKLRQGVSAVIGKLKERSTNGRAA